MTTTVTTTSTTPAAEADDLAVLTGPASTDLLRAALAGSAAAVPGLSVAVDRVHHRPGAGVSVGYRVAYGSPVGDVVEYLVASTAPRVPDGDGVAVLDDGERRVRVWRHPGDPMLPGLRAACDADRVRRWLEEAHLVPAGTDVRLTMPAYRPTRRAVVRADAGDVSVFLKVLPPRRADALVRRHLLLERSGVPAPRVLAQPAAGVVVLSAAAGRPLAQAVAGARTDPTLLPAPAAMVAFLDSLPAAAGDLPARSSWVDRLDFHAVAARVALPRHAGRIGDLEARVAALISNAPDAPQVPTHGDFYEANVFTDGGAVTGVIDVDSLGVGRRSDDLATLLGHLAVLPALAPGMYGHVPEITRHWLEHFELDVDRVELRARTAAVVLSLVAGTSAEMALARLEVAETWLADAERVAGMPPAPPSAVPTEVTP